MASGDPPVRGEDAAGLPGSRVTPWPCAPQVTTDLLSRGGKDIAFASYSPLWKFQRKLVHAALSMFGEGSLALEKISKCPPPPRYHVCVSFLSSLHLPASLLHPTPNILPAAQPLRLSPCWRCLLPPPWPPPGLTVPSPASPSPKSLPGGRVPV